MMDKLQSEKITSAFSSCKLKMRYLFDDKSEKSLTGLLSS